MQEFKTVKYISSRSTNLSFIERTLLDNPFEKRATGSILKDITISLIHFEYFIKLDLRRNKQIHS